MNTPKTLPRYYYVDCRSHWYIPHCATKRMARKIAMGEGGFIHDIRRATQAELTEYLRCMGYPPNHQLEFEEDYS